MENRKVRQMKKIRRTIYYARVSHDFGTPCRNRRGLLAMGFPLPPFDGPYSVPFASSLSALTPRQIVKLAGNGYHLHCNMVFMMYIYGYVRRRTDITGGPMPMLDAGCDGPVVCEEEPDIDAK